MTRFALLSLLTLAPLGAAAAQASALAGTWEIEYAAGMRIENDVPTPMMAKGTLTITVQGDSLVATLKTVPPPGMPERPAARFAASRPAGNEVTFKQQSTVTLNMNGEESQRTATSTWVLKADGDALSGTFERTIDGGMMPGPGATPVKGVRAR